jgi:hypothetical protein
LVRHDQVADAARLLLAAAETMPLKDPDEWWRARVLGQRVAPN